MNSFLRQLTEAGARHRYGSYDGKVREQIERELALIEKLEAWPAIFSSSGTSCASAASRTFWCKAAARRRTAPFAIRSASRRSIPIGMDLLFERFLSENRGEWPDIDLDLPSGDQRERAIQYVYERYGRWARP